MDVALKKPSVQRLTEVIPASAPFFSRRVLCVNAAAQQPYFDEGLQNVQVVSVSEKSVGAMLLRNEFIDAILINGDAVSPETSRLLEIARNQAVPVIMFTPEYKTSYAGVARRLGFDEYCSGILGLPFFRKVDSLKKLKEYRINRRRESAAVIVPKETIKMWSLKRFFDIVVSSFVLVLLSPLFLLIALLVKLESRGPVFYISKRAGAGYRIFNFYKFRTMRVGADAELNKLTHLNQYGANGKDIFFKIKNDPRITRVGSFLRNTSLDELPQLVNVLLGDMSLVGNRPLPLYEAAQLTKDQVAWRFLAPAGITGLWQISKRGKDNMSPEERIELDMEYARSNSFALDMKILFLTVPALLQKEKV